MNFYISDMHFYHQNILAFDKRPYKNLEEMHDDMIKKWNSVVNNNDTVYILGDFCWRLSVEIWRQILNKLKGQKVLITGNHDMAKVSQLKKIFADVKPYKEIKDGDDIVIMSHFPMPFYKHSFSDNVYMLYGHVHTTKENELMDEVISLIKKADMGNKAKLCNVGCMMLYMNYTPQTLETIKKVIDDRM